MARNLKPKCKQCRRIGESVCGKAKCALTRRNYTPGQHGIKQHTRLTQYGMQLREKQKAKLFYGVLERQFHNYYKQASKHVGNTSMMLMQLLEMRLDNVVYRAGLASTRRQARQLVNHGHCLVNQHNCNIPSRQVRIGDVISVKSTNQKSKYFENTKITLKSHAAPHWLQVNKDTLTITVLAVPLASDFEQSVVISLIVEYYSR